MTNLSRDVSAAVDSSALLKYFKEGVPDSHVANKYNLTESSIRTARVKAGFRRGRKYSPWTKSRVNQLHMFLRAGLSTRQIAGRLGRTVCSVKAKIDLIKSKNKVDLTVKTVFTDEHVCASCFRVFTRESKFLTRCKPCKSSEENRHG